MISHKLIRLQMRLIAVAAAAVLMVFGTATPVFAQQTREFEAEMHHFSAPQGPCENGVCNYVTYGVGFTNLMGSVAVTVVFTWDFNTTPCSTLRPDGVDPGWRHRINYDLRIWRHLCAARPG
jgi:hypothetical protein